MTILITEQQVASSPGRMPMRLIRLREVITICGLSRSSIYAAIQKNEFPQSVAIGRRARAWASNEIEAWVAESGQRRQIAGTTAAQLKAFQPFRRISARRRHPPFRGLDSWLSCPTQIFLGWPTVGSSILQVTPSPTKHSEKLDVPAKGLR
jgi:prophage regulatory protein